MITVENLSKSYGDKKALSNISFTVKPGRVTGFLGPNGAGKSTAMRVLLGLDLPSSGSATINGQRYRDLKNPLSVVGALLDARSVHPGRTAGSHLKTLATTHGIPQSRVREVAALTGLNDVLGRRVGGFSLGMNQRLGIAAALLGDPEVLVLDEPVNGLDPEGMRWVRSLLKQLAAEGRTVFLSSHLMSEMAVTAHELVVIGKGRILAQAPIDEFVKAAREVTIVRTDAVDPLVHHLKLNGMNVSIEPNGAISVPGARAQEVGQLALSAGVALTELRVESATLEDAYMGITADHMEYATPQLAEKDLS